MSREPKCNKKKKKLEFYYLGFLLALFFSFFYEHDNDIPVLFIKL